MQGLGELGVVHGCDVIQEVLQTLAALLFGTIHQRGTLLIVPAGFCLFVGRKGCDDRLQDVAPGVLEETMQVATGGASIPQGQVIPYPFTAGPGGHAGILSIQRFAGLDKAGQIVDVAQDGKHCGLHLIDHIGCAGADKLLLLLRVFDAEGGEGDAAIIQGQHAAKEYAALAAGGNILPEGTVLYQHLFVCAPRVHFCFDQDGIALLSVDVP